MERRSVKVILIGESSVGKTSIVHKFINNEFEEHGEKTSRVGISKKEVVTNNAIIDLVIWDTVGTEKFRAVAKNYFHKATVAVLCYSINNRHTSDVLYYWHNKVAANTGSTPLFYVVGNKCDLDPVQVHEKFESFIEDIGATHLFTSAKSGYNIVALFERIASDVAKLHERRAGHIVCESQKVIQIPSSLKKLNSSNSSRTSEPEPAQADPDPPSDDQETKCHC